MAVIGELLVRLGLDSKNLTAGLAVAEAEAKKFGSTGLGGLSGGLGRAERAALTEAGAIERSGVKAAEAAAKHRGLSNGLNAVSEIAGFEQMGAGTARLDRLRSTAGEASLSLGAVGLAGGVALAGVAAIGVGSLEAANKFQEAMVSVANNLNLPAAQADVLGQAVQNAALGTSTSATTMAQALGPVAGELARVYGGTLDAAKATDTLRAAQALQEGSNTPIAAGLKAITDTMLVYGKRAGDAAAVSDVFFQSQAQLGIQADTLGNVMQRLEPKLAGANLSFADTMAIVREMTPVVGTGTRALGKVGEMIAAISTPSAAAAKALDRVGVSLVDARGKFIGVPSAIDGIKAAYDRLRTPQEKAALLAQLFGKQAAIAKPLIEGGSAALKANAAALEKTGSAEEAAQRNAGTLADQQETLKATFSTTATIIGGALIPAVNSAMSAILPIVTAVAGWISQNRELTGIILLVVGALGAIGVALAVLGPVFAAIGAIGALIASPILLPILAVVAAIALLAANWDAVQRGVKVVADAIGGFLGRLPGIIGGVVGRVVGFVLSIPGRIAGFVTGFLGLVGRLVSGVIGRFVSLAARVVGFILGIPGRIAGFITGVVGTAASAAGQFVTRIVGLAGDVVRTILGIPGRIIGALVDGFASAAGQAVSAFMGAIAGLPGKVAGVLGSIPGNIAGAIGGIIPKFATGAWSVPATQLAVVHAGEMIIPADQAAMLRAGTGTPAVPFRAAPRADARPAPEARPARQGNVINVTVNNPAPEPASTSVSRELAKMQRLTAFGY